MIPGWPRFADSLVSVHLTLTLCLHPFIELSYATLTTHCTFTCILTTRRALICRTTAAAVVLMCVFVCSQRRRLRLRGLRSACTRIICQHLSAFVIPSQAFSLKVLDDANVNVTTSTLCRAVILLSYLQGQAVRVAPTFTSVDVIP